MGTVKSIAAARKAVREASAKAQQERARRERDNIEDLATFLVALDRSAAVDDWEAEKAAGSLRRPRSGETSTAVWPLRRYAGFDSVG